jgi:hypothetical protein
LVDSGKKIAARKRREPDAPESRHREAPFTEIRQAAPIGAQPDFGSVMKILGFRFAETSLSLDSYVAGNLTPSIRFSKH